MPVSGGTQFLFHCFAGFCDCSIYFFGNLQNLYGIFFIKAFFLYKLFYSVCAICPTGIIDGARCLSASGSLLCFVVFLALGSVGDDDDAADDDDAGVAANLGVYFAVALDLDRPWGA